MYRMLYALVICMTFTCFVSGQEDTETRGFVVDASGENQTEPEEISWGEAVLGRRLHVKTDKEEYAVGEEILLNVTLENVAEKSFNE